MKRIYLDNNATTPVLPPVLEAMLPFLSEQFGNPSSAHMLGLEAREAIERARDQVADLVGCETGSVVFTSSATEAINTAVSSATDRGLHCGRLVTTAVEHSAVLNYYSVLEKDGFEIVRVGVYQDGGLNLDELETAITLGTRLVSVMWVNNETGVKFPIKQVSELCQSKGVLLHVDAVQAAGKVPIALQELAIDYLSLSSHKVFGPKGVGALIVGERAPFNPLHVGGHQELGRRGGTENVAGIVGFGVATKLAREELDRRTANVRPLRDRLERAVIEQVPGAYINGLQSDRTPNTTSIGFPGVDSDTLVATLDAEGISVSAGSACLSDSLVPSHVIMAMTHSYAKASEAVRFSLSHLNTQEEIDRTIEALLRALSRAKQAASGSA